jgi:hypothetical protein
MKKVLLFSLAAMMLVLSTACKKDEPAPAAGNNNSNTNTGVEVQGDITSSTTWTAVKKYTIKGFVYVKSGATLTIEPGTVILGDKDSKGTLIIERGATINAAGTSAQPIVFTSAQAKGSRNYGDWGGIIICGKAPVNLPGGEGVIEGGVNVSFGGTDPADNSGTLKYVRIEFGGIAFQPNNEINGLTLGGVGSGTTIDHIQVSYSGDDAFEWFGGTVNAKYLISHRNWDDDFDTDNGFIGKVQFGLILRDPNVADQSGSNGFESDNDGQGTDATPFTAPVFSNVSVFGPLKTSTTTVDANYRRAAHIRRNSRTSIYNSLLTGFPTGLLVDGSKCETNATNGTLKIQKSILAGCATNFAVASGSTWDLAAWFNATAFTNTTLADYTTLSIADAFTLNAPVLLPGTGSVLLSGGDFTQAPLNDAFFTAVTYRGAFGTENWTSGWANFDPQNTEY